MLIPNPFNGETITFQNLIIKTNLRKQNKKKQKNKKCLSLLNTYFSQIPKFMHHYRYSVDSASFPAQP